MVNKFYQEQVQEVLSKHPLLDFDESKNRFYGNLVVDDQDNDTYQVIMDISPFPKRFPTVWETGERIPKTQDRHIYTSDNSCCFTTSAKEQILLKTKVRTLSVFIDEIAVKYFQNNSYFEINKKYKHGEYPHGVSGILAGYSDILDLKNTTQIVKILSSRLQHKKFGRNESCFCNSGKKFKKCHLTKYELLSSVDEETIKSDLERIFKMARLTS